MSLIHNRLALRTKLQNKINRGEHILSVYLTLGYPSLDQSLSLLDELTGKVDIIEIGIPFSDPIADGKTIQYTNTYALENGVKTNNIWKAIEIVNKGNTSPVVMTYGNILYQYGFDKFIDRGKKTGLEGIILPDVPFNYQYRVYQELDPIYIVSPNTEKIRIQKIVEKTTGFIYVLSTMGTTGGVYRSDRRLKMLYSYISEIQPKLPKLQGFGIVSTKDVRNALDLGADGIIIGSEILRRFGDQGNTDRVLEFVEEILSALK